MRTSIDGYVVFYEALEAKGLLRDVRPDGQGSFYCPAHDDEHASGSFREGDEHPVVFNCKAGCSPDAILQALELTWKDIMKSDRSDERKTASKVDDLEIDADLWGLEDYGHHTPEPIEWAIPNLAPRSNFTWLYAVAGSGKSSLIHEAVVANAMGRPFLNVFDFDDEQRFLVFDFESTKDQVTRSLERLGLRTKKAEDTFHWLYRPREAQLDTSEGRDYVYRVAEKVEATCLIFENRQLMFRNTGELDGKQVGDAMDGARELAMGLHAGFVVISHEPKATYNDPVAQLTGHSAWANLSDQMFRYTKKRRGDGSRYLEHAKYRGLDKRPTVRVALELSGEQDTGPMTLRGQPFTSSEERQKMRKQDEVRTFCEALKELGPSKVSELAEHLGFDRSDRAFRSTRDQAEDQGLVEKRDSKLRLTKRGRKSVS
jgi:hypothetical protein